MIPLHKVLMSDNALKMVADTMYSGNITEGAVAKRFEDALSNVFGTKVLLTNSCTSAIDLALHLIGVGAGDEVISTPMTCAATNTHVVLRGAKLVWADVSSTTGNIWPESVAESVTDKTKAIIVVDWGGRPVDCDEIRRRLPRHIPIIQDAAHSFLARYEDGSRAHCDVRSGDYVAWSFQAIKHLTTGDGGALNVPSGQRDRARRLRWFGIDREVNAKFRFLQNIEEAGYKYHMNDLTASIGLANLDESIRSVSKCRLNALELQRILSEATHIKAAPPSAGSSWWFFSILTPRWEEFVEFSAQNGIGAGPVHGRNDSYTAHGASDKPLPGVDAYSSQHVAVPCGWWVDDVEEIGRMILAWDKRL